MIKLKTLLAQNYLPYEDIKKQLRLGPRENLSDKDFKAIVDQLYKAGDVNSIYKGKQMRILIKSGEYDPKMIEKVSQAIGMYFYYNKNKLDNSDARFKRVTQVQSSSGRSIARKWNR